MVYRPDKHKSKPKTMEYRPERDVHLKDHFKPITPPNSIYDKTEVQLLSQRKNIKRYPL